MIRFELMNITVEMAAKWLRENNEGNRAIRPSVVKKYAQDLILGYWRLTHQCVAFDSQGRLIDGQHRLSAIVLANKSMTAYVAYYDSREEAMKLPIDMQATRAMYDVLQVSRRDQETCAALYRYLVPYTSQSVASLDMMVTGLRNELDWVHACVTTTVKQRSAAPARAAIVTLLREFPHEKEDLCRLYRAFVGMDLEGLPSSIMALIKNLDGASLLSGGGGKCQKELYLRVYYAFHPRNRSVKVIRLADQDALMREIRKTTAETMKGIIKINQD